MTAFADKLAELRERATKGPLIVDPVNWELVCIDGHHYKYLADFSVPCAVTDHLSDEQIKANAAIYVFLANHAEAIEKVVRHSDALMKLLKHSVDVGPHDNPRTEAHHCRALRDALNELNKEG